MLIIAIVFFFVVFLLAGLLWTALQPLYHDTEALFDEFEQTSIFRTLRLLTMLPLIVLLIVFSSCLLFIPGAYTMSFILTYSIMLSGLLLVTILFLIILFTLFRLWERLPVMPVVGLLCTLPMIIYLTPLTRLQTILASTGSIILLVAALALFALWYLLLWQTHKRFH